MTKKKIIDNIIYTITQLCNYQCRMCHCWKSKRSIEHLTTSQIIDSIKSLSKIYELNNSVILTGGEPLLNKNITDIVKACNNVGFNSTLNTNGSLLTKLKLISLIDNKLTSLSVSLDSLNESKHDKIRGRKGAYKSVINLIDTFSKLKSKYKPTLTIMVVIMKDNINEIDEMIKWANSLDIINTISFQVLSTPLNFSNETIWANEFDHLIERDIAKINYSMSNLLKLKNKNKKIGNSQKQIKFFWKYLINNEFSNIGVCHVDQKSIFVDECGKVRICPYNKTVTNVIVENFEDQLLNLYTPKLIDTIRHCEFKCNTRLNCLISE